MASQVEIDVWVQAPAACCGNLEGVTTSAAEVHGILPENFEIAKMQILQSSTLKPYNNEGTPFPRVPLEMTPRIE